MKIRHTTRVWLIPLALGWIFDLLFWKKAPGVSFPLFVVLCLASGLFLAYGEGRQPAKKSYFLLPLILIFAVLFAARMEPLTTFANFALTLGLMTLLAVTLLGGRWLQYSVSDYVAKFFILGLNALVNPLKYFARKHAPEEIPAPEATKAEPNNAWRKGVFPVLRGLLIAIPVIALLAALLAAADPIFSDSLVRFLDLFRIENLGELIFRAFYIVVLGFVLMGILLHAMIDSQEETLIGKEKPWLSPFLGWIEAAIVLGSIDLLFAFFVAIQFRYFFGGQANINVSGFTYAEYARRGFGELVGVAFISLLIFLGLSGITRRATPAQRRSFSGLGVLLVGLVIVILVSAFQRVLLYEAAYGFSRVRTYTHVFIIWLGVLLVATIILEILQHTRYFATAALVCVIGFGLTLNIMNVDAFIVQQNVNRARLGETTVKQDSGRLDTSYFMTLSADAVPEMVQIFQSPGTPAAIRSEIGAALACQQVTNSNISLTKTYPWPSYHLSRDLARKALSSVQEQLKAFPVQMADREAPSVTVNGKALNCYTFQAD